MKKSTMKITADVLGWFIVLLATISGALLIAVFFTDRVLWLLIIIGISMLALTLVGEYFLKKSGEG